MSTIRRVAAALLAGAFASAGISPAFAHPAHARFGNAPIYAGGPNLPLLLSTVVAGGGPASFDATRLVRVLAGAETSAEIASLQATFGTDGVRSFLDVFDYVVRDALDKLAAAKVALPTTPEPAPTDGKALAAALYARGVEPRTQTFDAEYLLDGLVTHAVHVAVMNDVDATYGRAADGIYHAVLARAMTDLATPVAAPTPRAEPTPDERESLRATPSAVGARRRREA